MHTNENIIAQPYGYLDVLRRSSTTHNPPENFYHYGSYTLLNTLRLKEYLTMLLIFKDTDDALFYQPVQGIQTCYRCVLISS